MFPASGSFRRLSGASVIALAATVACSHQPLPAPTDAGAGDAGPASPWACIGSVKPLPSGGMTTVTLQLLDTVTNGPIMSGLSVKVCDGSDSTCSTPLSMTTSSTSTGSLSVTVTSDFAGYLDIEDSTMTYLPSLVTLNLTAEAQNPTVLLITGQFERQLASAIGGTVDPTAGLILVTTVDCTGAAAAGVSLNASPPGSAPQFYIVNDVPTDSATQTDSSGNTGTFNAPAGTVALTATMAATGKEIGKQTAIVRAGAVTYVLFGPTSTL